MHCMQVVLVTGASSGIGAGTALQFATKGVRLVLTARSKDRLEDTVQKCLAAGAREVLPVGADLTIEADVLSVIQKTIEKFGRLDVLVNVAGISKAGSLETTTLSDFKQVLNTNLWATFFLTQQAMPHLLASKGNVVNVSSATSVRPFTSNMAYGMSKAALDHFTRMAALEVSPKGVRVNEVNPGVIDTSIHDAGGVPVEVLGKTYSALGRAGRVDEVAKAILYLADDEQSSYVTGISLFVDGGCTIVGPSLDE